MLRQVVMQQSTDVDQHYCHRKSRMLQLFWQAFHGTEGDTIIRSIPINIPNHCSHLQSIKLLHSQYLVAELQGACGLHIETLKIKGSHNR